MDNENTSGDVYYYYEIDNSGVEDLLEEQQELILEVQSDVQQIHDDLISFSGILVGLIGLIIGFHAFKELLKIWVQ